MLILDISCQHLGDECKLEGFCAPFGRRVGVCTFLKLYICNGYMHTSVEFIHCSKAKLSGAQLSTFSGRTVGPCPLFRGPIAWGPTVRGPICQEPECTVSVECSQRCSQKCSQESASISIIQHQSASTSINQHQPALISNNQHSLP